MRVINIVRIKEGVVDNIESFGVFEEQLSQEVVEKAEEEFQKQAKELGFEGDDEELDEITGEGYFECPYANASVCLSWSEI